MKSTEYFVNKIASIEDTEFADDFIHDAYEILETQRCNHVLTTSRYQL